MPAVKSPAPMAIYPTSRMWAMPGREIRKAPICLALAVMVASLPVNPVGVPLFQILLRKSKHILMLYRVVEHTTPKTQYCCATGSRKWKNIRWPLTAIIFKSTLEAPKIIVDSSDVRRP
jgi:hypothetical protein